MRIVLEGILGIRGLKFSLLISLILGIILGAYFLLIQQIFIGALFFMMAFESYRSWSETKHMDAQDTDEELQNLIKEGVDDLQAGRMKDALDKFIFIRQQAPKGLLYVSATEYAAHILAAEGQYKRAYDWLFPLQNRLSTEYLILLHQIAFRTEEWEQTVKIGKQAYEKFPSADTALINAYAYSILGQATPAVGWLRCAIQLGLPNIEQIIEKREFDAIRNTPAFQDWLKGL